MLVWRGWDDYIFTGMNLIGSGVVCDPESALCHQHKLVFGQGTGHMLPFAGGSREMPGHMGVDEGG